MPSIPHALRPLFRTCTRRFSKASIGCIKVMADETRRYDDRNRASHEEAKRIMEYLRANGRHIPLK